MWETMTLEKVCKIISGNSIPAKKKEEYYTDVEGMPYVATKDVGFNGAINYENGIFIPDEYLSGFKISPAFATLVCAEGGSAGRKIAFSTEECCFVNKLFSLQPNENIIPKFIYYYTLGTEFQSQFKEAMHGLIGGVSLSKIKDFYISIPPLAEQQRIVAKLDAAFAEIDTLIGLAKSEVEELSKLKSSLITQCLYADGALINNALLGDIIEKTETVNPSSAFPNEEFDYVDVSSVNRNSLEIEETQTLLGKKAPSRARRLIKNNDVIFATIRPTLKRVAIVPDYLNNQICSTGYIVLRPKPDTLLSSFLFYFLISDKVLFEMEQLQSGASYPAVTDSQVKSLFITYPSIAEQQLIVTKLNTTFSQLGNVETLINEKLINLNALKSAILAQELQSEVA